MHKGQLLKQFIKMHKSNWRIERDAKRRNTLLKKAGIYPLLTWILASYLFLMTTGIVEANTKKDIKEIEVRTTHIIHNCLTNENRTDFARCI